MVLPSGGTGVSRSWNLNSIYDPDRTGVGHQPLGHDEWSTMYTRYRVYGISYEIALTNTGSTGMVIGSLNTTPYAPGSTFLDVGTFELPRSRKFKVGNLAGNSTYTMRGYFKVNAVLGQTSEQYRTDPNNTALFTASPTNIACVNLNAIYADTSNAATLQVYTRLIYHCELLDPEMLTISSTGTNP